MQGYRPFGLLGDYADEQNPSRYLQMNGGGVSGSTPVGADDLGRLAYGFTGLGGAQDAAGLLGGPSLRENIQNGNKLDAFLQAVGTAPLVGGAAKGLLGGAKLAAAIPAAVKAARVAEEAAPSIEKSIVAYHGSPHSFDRFDLSKIGSGEGAQAFGHGLYFADNEGVARSYRDALQHKAPVEPIQASGGPAALIQNAIREARKFPEEERMAALNNWLHETEGMASGKFAPPEMLENVKEAKRLIASGEVNPNLTNGGSMYQVRINADPEHFLDWDKPLSAQSPHVQQAIQPRLETLKSAGAQFSEDPTGQTLWRAAHPQGGVDVTDFNIGPAAQGSQILREAGIPGIKYLDQGSRGAGEGSRNYVVFDDKMIDILKKYGLVGLLGGGAALGSNQQQGAPSL